jgi:uncharacterized protein YuzE
VFGQLDGPERPDDGHDERVRIEYDTAVDAAYIYLTEAELTPGRDTIPAHGPPGVEGEVILDWKDGKLVGIEVLGARALLRPDLLDQATPPATT